MSEEKNINIKKIIKLIIIFITILVIVYVFCGIFKLIKQPTDTFMVENGKVSLSESINGYVLREEIVVKGENYKNGIVKIKEEGQKVAKDSPMFRYYSNGENDLIKNIEKISEQIQDAMENETNLFSSDILLLEQQIEFKLNQLYKENNIQKVAEIKKEINTYTIQKSKIAGELSPSGSNIRNLIDKRSKLEKKLNSGSEYKKAPISGIVSYRVDKLEEVLTTENFEYINKQFLQNLDIKTGQIIESNNECGKVVNNFCTYIAVVSNSEKTMQAKVGDKLNLQLSNENEIPAKIVYINEEEGSRVLIFEIYKGVEELINYRKVSLDIIWWQDVGLKVPNSAIIYKDDNAYIIRKRAGYLTPILIKVLKQTENYTIIQNYTTKELKEKDYLIEETKNIKKITLYDEIILNPTKEMLQ